MSIIHLVLLAKAVEEQQKRTGAKQSSTQSQNKQRKNEPVWVDSYYDNSDDIENFLENVLEADADATKLFLLLEECKKQIDEEDYQTIIREVQNICSEYEEQDKLLHEAIISLKVAGIKPDKTEPRDVYYCSKKVEDGHGFGNYGTYSYDFTTHYTIFNGMPLTKEMIESNTNHFQIDLDKFNQENPNLDEQLAELTLKITKQKRNLKYNPFNREKKQALLDDMLKLETELKEKIESRTTLENQSKTFSSLNPVQKQALISYLNQVEICIAISKHLGATINSNYNIRYDHDTNTTNAKRNVNQRIIERAAEQSEFTVEEIENIIERIRETIKKNEVSFMRYKRLNRKKSYHHPTTPESMFAAKYFDEIYQEKRKSKKH